MIKNKKGHFDFATLVISIVGGIIGYAIVVGHKFKDKFLLKDKTRN